MERNLNIRVPAQLYEDFDRACAYNYTNKSAVVKQFMVEYVRQNQKNQGVSDKSQKSCKKDLTI